MALETVHAQFHPDETHLPYFIINTMTYHYFGLCGISFNVRETSMKPPLGMT